MMPFAVDQAVAFSLALVGVFFVAVPLIIGVLVLLAAIQAHGEKTAYELKRKHTPLEPPHHLPDTPSR
jgi:hypothetical protein